MNTNTQHTSPTPDTSPTPSARRPRRTKTWCHRIRSGTAAIAAAAMVGIGGATFMTAQDASAAGVSQHNYAIISQSQSQPSTPPSDKDPDDE
ncbi:hypothetical protein [Acidipropionibacterium virtanenii]|nr:hypothetical protein [Acidipropionibacterium virtanenii]